LPTSIPKLLLKTHSRQRAGTAQVQSGTPQAARLMAKFTATDRIDSPDHPAPPSLTTRLIRRALGRDPKTTAQLQNRIGFEATMRRIEREGA
jgi:hypothetical protein